MAPSTFSIVAADRRTGELGVAVQSKFLAVGALVPHLRAGVGAIATQAFANVGFGPQGLVLLASGLGPEAVLELMLADAAEREQRHVGIVAADGRAASFTGSQCIASAGGFAAPNCAIQGNCLVGPAVVAAMRAAFEVPRAQLADRLLAALRAGQAAGGDARGQQSAALAIEKPAGGYLGTSDRFVDLRVDDHAQPIEELARLLELHKLYFFPAAPEDVRAIDDALGATLVAELARLGALDHAHKHYDAVAREALVRLMHVENLENRVRADGSVDRQTLDYLASLGRA